MDGGDVETEVDNDNVEAEDLDGAGPLIAGVKRYPCETLAMDTARAFQQFSVGKIYKITKKKMLYIIVILT